MRALTLILSESEFLASLELQRVRARWEAKGYGVEEAPAADLQALFYALDTPSLFGGGRLVVVRSSGTALDAAAERLADWAASPPPEVAAVIVAGRAAKLKKALTGRAEILEPEAPKPWQVQDWVVRFTKGHGRAMSKEAAAALVEAVGTDLRDLAGATEQLLLSTKGPISPEDVSRMFRGMETQLYTFLETLLSRDRAGALRHVGALMRAGVHPLVLVATLAKQFRALAAAREAGRTPPAQLARELDVAVGHVNRAQKLGRNFDSGELRQAFRSLADADLALKGGERGEEQSPELLIEMLVAELAGDRPAPQRQTGRARR